MGVDLDRKTPDAEEQGARLNDAVVGLSLGLDGYVKILSRVGPFSQPYSFHTHYRCFVLLI